MSLFDVCVITASDETQAAAFRVLLERRVKAGLYPREIDFRVYCDPPTGRAGSGGGTLWALRRFLEESGVKAAKFPKVLMIHAGGESRRLPCYQPEGKLFAPIPSPSSALLPPVVLDVALALYLKYPWRARELVVASGDVIIDFDTDFLDLADAPLCGFAAPTDFRRGARHGVFVFHPLSGAVVDYLQKAAPEELARSARIEGTESCAVDLGIVAFAGAALSALLGLAEKHAGIWKFDLYLELLTAALDGLSLADFRERVAARSALAPEALSALYEAFHPTPLAGFLVKRAAFIHFGSLTEYPAAGRELGDRSLIPFYGEGHEELLPELAGEVLSINCLRSTIRAASGGTVFAENCADIDIAVRGDNLLVGLRDYSVMEPLPDGFCLDERCLSDGRRLRLVYHRADTFKRAASLADLVFCGQILDKWLSERHLHFNDIISPTTMPSAEPGAPSAAASGADLLALPLFVPDSDSAFLTGYWRVPDDRAAWALRFRNADRLSISQANVLSDLPTRDRERADNRAAALVERLNRGGFYAVSRRDFIDLTARGGADHGGAERGSLDLSALALRWAATDEPLLRAYRACLLRSVGAADAETAGRLELDFAAARVNRQLEAAVKLDQIVWTRSPVRLDLAGGWTDTPPYTNRYGGAVVNVAVDLNGQPPIQVFVRRTSEPRIRIHSIDLGETETITDTAALRAYRAPGSPFALPKAALVLLGAGGDLADGAELAPYLAAAGGGIELTLLCAVPKGSGLGTSSILAGVILAALERFYGLADTPEELYLKVLEMEQMLTTGGGWQDQIGGLAGGVKYIVSKPALKPRPIVHQLDPWLFESPASADRMTLFYTGVTRLAKGLLQEVVDGVNSLDRAYLFTHKRIGEMAHEAREAISRRDLEKLSWIISQSFRENKLIHASTTNADMETMIAACAPYTAGVKLLGAGGGGFALFVSPDATAAAALRRLLAERWEDDRARLVNFALNKRGLETTVS